jgi:iron-sulfur cluster repair protein YtfE (RIC family)
MPRSMDVAAAKAKGLEKAIHARRGGLVGVFQTIAKQHGEVGALLERVKKAPDKQESLWPKIKVALLAHERSELEVVYPAMNRYHALKRIVAQHAEEASQLEDMIDRLDEMSPESAEWTSLFGSLRDTVLSHVHEEETEFFPVAIGEMGPERAKDLDAKFKAAFKAQESALRKTRH